MGEPITYRGFYEGYHIEVVDFGLQDDTPGLAHPKQYDITPLLWAVLTGSTLISINEVQTGKLLFNAIRAAGGNWVRIVPRLPYVGYGRDTNAATDTDPLYLVNNGRAKVSIRFSPHHLRMGTFCDRKDDANCGLNGKEILFHELVHAMRFVTKKHQRHQVHDGLFRYDTNEEFYAVLLTNIFISDPSNTAKSGLRRDHQTQFALDQQLAGSFEFFRSSPQVYPLIAQFFKDHPALSHDIACKINAPFNPLRAYDSSPAKAKEISNSVFSKVRAGVGSVIESVDPEAVAARFMNPLLALVGRG